MHKSILILFAAIVYTSSAPVNDDVQTVLSYEFTNDGNGNYKFSYETPNGLIRKETGEVVNAGQKGEYIVIRGVFSYIDCDGNLHKELYTVDENGYHRSGLSAALPETGIEAGFLPEDVVASMLGR